MRFGRRFILMLSALLFPVFFTATGVIAQEKNFWATWYEVGSTEGGSSGSALLNKDGRVIGQLTGGNASCANVGDSNAYDIFGKFIVSWDEGVGEFLGAGGVANHTDTTLGPPAEKKAVRALPPGAAFGLRADESRIVVAADEDMDRMRAEFEMRVSEGGDSKPTIVGAHVDAPAINPGDWQRIDAGEGRASWRLVLRAPGAEAVRLHIEDITPELADAAWVYSPDDPLAAKPLRLAPLDTPASLWSPPVSGDAVALEIAVDSDAPPLIVPDRISCRLIPAAKNGWEKEGSCYTDIVCEPQWNMEKFAVGQMWFELEDYEAVCTGSLVMDRALSYTPYFLTAAHCFQSAYSAESLIVSFFYYTEECGGQPPNWDDTPYSYGSTILHRSTVSDDLLLQLADPLPAGIAYLGWSLAAPSIGDPITVIHHPGGYQMRISHGYLKGESADEVFDDDDDDDYWSDDDTQSLPPARGSGDDDDGGGCGCGGCGA